jgi:predicted esterase
VWLQNELTEYAKARISDNDFVDARAALESPELIGFFVGGGGGETSEEDVLEDMKLMARAIRRRLRRSGAKLGPDPVD